VRMGVMGCRGREGVVRIRMGRLRGGRVWRILRRGGDLSFVLLFMVGL
jgi:hypothetical protein